jgi:hypothetical protein
VGAATEKDEKVLMFVSCASHFRALCSSSKPMNLKRRRNT